MSSRGLFLTVLLGLVSLAALWWWQNRYLTPEERLFFGKIDAATIANPPNATDIVEAFDLARPCSAESCFFEANSIGNLRYSKGNLRPLDDGLIFHIEGFSNTCIRTQRAKAYFSAQRPEQACSHGGCWGTDAQYPWGILVFELEARHSTCISGFVINSMPEQRTDK